MDEGYRRALAEHILSQARIDRAEAIEFAALFRLRRLAEKEHLLVGGEIARLAAFIASGAVREYFMAPDGTEFNKSFAFAGEFTGSYFDLLSQKPSLASIQAMTVTELLVAPFTKIQAFYERSLEWQRIARNTAESLFMKKAKREYEFVSLTAEERYRKFVAEHAAMLDKIPQYHLASFLGITPVALSRIRKRVGKSAGINPG